MLVATGEEVLVGTGVRIGVRDGTGDGVGKGD